MKRTAALLLAVCLMLTGCQLAVEEAGEHGYNHQDRLVGVVVTTEYLDLFDMEAYLQDNLDDIMDGDVVEDDEAYQGRIYAQETVEETTTEDGVPCTTTYYNFDHVEGISLLHYEVKTYLQDGSVHAQFTTGTCDEGMWDVTLGGEWNEGTIFVPMDAPETVFYVNPVYQDGEGRLYLMAGSGVSMSEYVGSMSQSIAQENTLTIDGEQIVQKDGFRITVEGKTVCQSVTVLQMSGDHQILDTLTCAPEELPTELKPEADCGYILVEESDGETVNRLLLQPGDEWYTAYIRSEAVYCTGKTMELLWPEK